MQGCSKVVSPCIYLSRKLDQYLDERCMAFRCCQVERSESIRVRAVHNLVQLSFRELLLGIAQNLEDFVRVALIYLCPIVHFYLFYVLFSLLLFTWLYWFWWHFRFLPLFWLLLLWNWFWWLCKFVCLFIIVIQGHILESSNRTFLSDWVHRNWWLDIRPHCCRGCRRDTFDLSFGIDDRLVSYKTLRRCILLWPKRDSCCCEFISCSCRGCCNIRWAYFLWLLDALSLAEKLFLASA